MRTGFLASTATLAILAAPAAAQLSIGAPQTAPARTSTAGNGGRGTVTVAANGTIEAGSGAAITQDSADAVANAGRLQVNDADNATAIDISAAGGGVTNSGRIILDETYKPTDADKDGDLDGAFAQGTGKAGIRTRGAYAGAITNASGGSITVQGNGSAGILLGGPLTGNLTQEGTIAVVGDRSVGVRTGDVTGKVRLAGTITATGLDASAARIDAAVNGLLEIQGTLSATGYRATTLPTSVDKLDADDLLQGGPAVAVTGSVTGGIVFAVPPADTSPTITDEDKDGIEDAREGSAAVSSFGAAPAVSIGSATAPLAVGAVAGRADGFGLVIDGTVQGQGVYAGVAATGIVLGGQGGAVTVANGMAIGGRVVAGSNGASATAVRLGAGTSVPVLVVTGGIGAAGGNATAAQATALLVEAGASLPTVRNSGVIEAVAAGADGNAAGIRDQSGTLRLVENSGTIRATGALTSAGRAVAIDLSAAIGAATIRQTGTSAAAIVGDVLTGSGNDLLDVQAGSVAGTVRFGAGDDALVLGGASRFAGQVDYGTGGGTLQIGGTAAFEGSLINSGLVAATVTAGALRITAPSRLASLGVGATGTLGLTLSAATRTAAALAIGGTAQFDRGATLAVAFSSLVGVEGRHTLLSAGNLVGIDGVTLSQASLPFLFKGTLATAPTAVTIDVARKSAGELGLNAQSGQLYDAAYAALANDADIAGAFLGVREGDAFRASLSQLLPDQADGTFEMVTMGSRATARVIADPAGLLREEGDWGWWAAPVGWQLRTGSAASGGYEVSGWGAAAGVERKTGIGNFGAALAYLDGRQSQRANANRVTSAQYELAGYWRGHWGGLAANARVSAARVDFDGRRRFIGTNGTTAIDRRATSSWDGDLFSGAAAISYELGGQQFFVRPIAALDYYHLREDAHREAEGGKAFALSIARRTSDELAGTASIAAGIDFFNRSRNFMGSVTGENWFRLEAEGGRREILTGALGATIAQFEGGQRFTIDPDQRDSGWIGRLRAIGGSYRWRLAGEVGAEERQGDVALSVRGSLLVRL